MKQINRCKAVRQEGIRFANTDAHKISFGFGGDANCTIGPWTTAFCEFPSARLTFSELQFMWGVNKKGGDLMVGAGTKDLLFFENQCSIQGREKQHDPMIMKWWYRARPETQPVPLPARSSGGSLGPPPDENPIDDDSGNSPMRTMPPTPPDSDTDLEIGSDAVDADTLGKDAESEDEDTVGAAEHDENHFDELRTVGFAIAKSLTFLREFNTTKNKRNCIDVVWLKAMDGVCTDDDRNALRQCMSTFFCRRPQIRDDSGPPRQDPKAALALKSRREIEVAWETILAKRREVQPNDRVPITDRNTRTMMHQEWFHQFCRDELTPEQQKQPLKSKSSIFNVYLHNNMGGKKWVMAIWQMGITWAPTEHMLDTDFDGALKHVAKNFAAWVRRLARALAREKEDSDYQDARRKSGGSYGKHGLTPEEVQLRKSREQARKNLAWAKHLQAQLNASKGKGKHKSGATEHTRKGKGKKVLARSWHEFSLDEQSLLEELRSGRLEEKKRKTEAMCSKTQAKDFAVDDEEQLPGVPPAASALDPRVPGLPKQFDILKQHSFSSSLARSYYGR